MRSVSVLAAAVIIGVSLLTVACGHQRPGPAASGPAATRPAASAASGNPSATSPAASAPAAACGSTAAVPGPGRTLTLSNTDNGRSFCVRRGTGVLIYLHGTATARWNRLRSSSAALVPSANGHLMLALGVTGGYFVATQPGSAVISSARSRCGQPAAPPSASAASGKASCGTVELFRVTIKVA
jgi:hypothetical protein